MKITPKQNAIHVDKEEGSSVDYYIYPEYEIHYNEIKPGTVQVWHHHPTVSETLYVVDGEIEAHWLNENGQKEKQIVKAGDVVEVENTPHTFINTGSGVVKFVVFRFVPTGEDKREIIKNDKVLDTHLD
jgi:quercetin dioxygenase-like cupin family protein